MGNKEGFYRHAITGNIVAKPKNFIKNLYNKEKCYDTRRDEKFTKYSKQKSKSK